MRIVYVALRSDYGDAARGPSFEEQAFYDTLARSRHHVIPFDFFDELLRVGYEEMNRRLLELVRETDPDLLFCVLFEEQLDPRVIAEISERTRTTTFNWFCDDHWRFDAYSRHWAPVFNYVATTDATAHARYHALGMRHALLTQWGYNPALFHPEPSEDTFDVTFVGQPHADRRKLVRALRRSGANVECWGHGWENGRVSVPRMREIFGASRINLNFAAASVGRRRRLLQLKARPFEIAGCGGFVLTQETPDLARYLKPGTEVGVFRSRRELVRQTRHYLESEAERSEMAAAAHRRVLAEHTYAHRLEALFAAMDLETGLVEAAAA